MNSTHNELNPLARFLMENMGMWSFIAFKVAALFFIIEALRRMRPRYTYAILIIQLITLGFLLS